MARTWRLPDACASLIEDHLDVDQWVSHADSEPGKLAVAMSALTTLFSFGLLSLSATHAIANFGLVALGGITASFLLAPMTRGITKRHRKEV